jgi:hypothetical protein
MVRVALVLESPWRPACIPVFAGIGVLLHCDVGDADFIADEHNDAAGLAPEGKSPALRRCFLPRSLTLLVNSITPEV